MADAFGKNIPAADAAGQTLASSDRKAVVSASDAVPAPFRMRLADLLIDVHPLNQGVVDLCANYAVPLAEDAPSAAPADIVVRTTQADIDAERAIAIEGHSWSDSYLETLAVLRAIANQLPQRRRLLMHGAVIEYAGGAYLFTAPSGTGKSTHIALWRRYVGSAVRVINGDKPFLYVPERPGELPIAYGTPWAGKEGWQENASAPLAGIVLLSRSQPGASEIRQSDAAACLDRIIRQAYLPNDPLAVACTLELLDAMLSRVPVYELACDMSENAVRVSFEALTGQRYE